jgi:hypothetical protein
MPHLRGRLRGDHERLVSASHQVFGRPDDRVRDTVDVRQERLRDQRDTHAHTMIASSVQSDHAVVAGKETVGNKTAVCPLFASKPLAVARAPRE